MIKAYFSCIAFATFALLSIKSCFTQTASPTYQFIKGPYEITAEWQIIELTASLKTWPHIQILEILLDSEKYEYYKDVPSE